jgi:hypothetical protein
MAEIVRELGVGEPSLGYWMAKDGKARPVADAERFGADPLRWTRV